MLLAGMNVNWQYMQNNIAFMQARYEERVNWNALKIFLAIAESGTLTGAAKTLEVNHSTVFRRLNTFEVKLAGDYSSA